MTIEHEIAAALTEAGIMPLPQYLELCRQNGWEFEYDKQKDRQVADDQQSD